MDPLWAQYSPDIILNTIHSMEIIMLTEFKIFTAIAGLEEKLGQTLPQHGSNMALKASHQ